MPLLDHSLIEKSPSLSRAITLSVAILDFCSLLENDKHFVIANQLLKAGTSIGANIAEAQEAESRADFIHKMKVAMKECGETNYWLLLCYKCYKYASTSQLLEQNIVLYNMLGKIISTAKKNQQNTLKKPKS